MAVSVARAISAASGAAANRAASRSRPDSTAVNGRGPIQPSDGASGPGADDILMHRAASESHEPGPASVARRSSGSGAGKPAAAKSERLDHRAGVGPPQPGAAGDDRVRCGDRQGAAGERHTVLDQPRAELGQEPVGVGRGGAVVDEPRKRRGELHGADHAGARGPLSPAAARGYALMKAARPIPPRRRPEMSNGGALARHISKPGVLEMDESLIVQRETHIAAPPATVFAFLTDPEKILRWMGADATTEPHPGGTLPPQKHQRPPGARRLSRGRAGPSPRLQFRLGGR